MVDFAPGERVLCIDGDFSMRSHLKGITWPEFGKTYTVRAYVADRPVNILVVNEIRNRRVPYMGMNEAIEAGFWERRFIAISPEEEKIMEGDLVEA